MPARNDKGGVTIRDVTRTAVAMEQLSKQYPAETNYATIEELCFLCGPCPGVIKRTKKIILVSPCGGGVEYLRRDPASRRRRREGKSQI
jgi:hypothetical protein